MALQKFGTSRDLGKVLTWFKPLFPPDDSFGMHLRLKQVGAGERADGAPFRVLAVEFKTTGQRIAEIVEIYFSQFTGFEVFIEETIIALRNWMEEDPLSAMVHTYAGQHTAPAYHCPVCKSVVSGYDAVYQHIQGCGHKLEPIGLEGVSN